MLDFDTAKNLPSMFFGQAEKYGAAPFLWHKTAEGWQSKSWRDTATEVSRLSRGLRGLGVSAGDRVLIVSENRPEWMIADLAIMAAGAVAVPAYTTNTVDNHTHVLRDSGARIAIVSGPALAERLLPACQETGVTTIVTMAALDEVPQGIAAVDWNAVMAQGAGFKDDIGAKVNSVARGDLAAIIYTSGTGGDPTGVMLSHGNMICNVMGADNFLRMLPGFADGQESFLSFLPLSHSYEHTVGQFVPIAIGAQIYYAEGLDKLVQNIAEVRPTIMTAVPRLYESMRGRILRGAEQAGGLKLKMLRAALRLGTKAYEDPKSLSIIEKLQNAVLDKLVRKKVAERFGGRLKAFVSGGAPLNYDVGVFFLSLGLRILQGYGQTESAPVVSVNLPNPNKLRTVGPPLKGVDVKIADDGEILVAGELVMLGYWGKPERSAETVRDGWLHTGDIGELDENGYIRITDRKKDIIVNSGGDNISPQRVEGILCLEAAIGQTMVHGDKRPHLVALIVPDADFVKDWRREAGVPGSGLEGLASNDDFRKTISAAIDRANADLSVIEKVRRFIIAEDAFTVDNGMMTPSMKIRRHIIKQSYGEALDGLYAKAKG